jgi:hypothetical protein
MLDDACLAEKQQIAILKYLVCSDPQSICKFQHFLFVQLRNKMSGYNLKKTKYVTNLLTLLFKLSTSVCQMKWSTIKSLFLNF